MEIECRFSYSDLDDSLMVSWREENENIRENFQVGEIIFSLTGRGKIVGMQIRELTNLLLERGIDEKIISKLDKINAVIIKKDNALYLGLALFGKEMEKVMVPIGLLPVPQVAK